MPSKDRSDGSCERGLIDWADADKMSRMADGFRHDLLVGRATFLSVAGLSALQLDRALRTRRLFAVNVDDEDYIPQFFLDGRYDRGHLQAVCKALGELPGGSKLQFFMTPKGSLSGQTPLEALLDRKAELVRRAAHGFAER